MSKPNNSPDCRDYARGLLRDEASGIARDHNDDLVFAQTARDVGDKNAGPLLQETIELAHDRNIAMGVIARLAARINADQRRPETSPDSGTDQPTLF